MLSDEFNQFTVHSLRFTVFSRSHALRGNAIPGCSTSLGDLMLFNLQLPICNKFLRNRKRFTLIIQLSNQLIINALPFGSRLN
jgi:hypothetical protein